MKEITRIHLAKTPFSIEIEAKKALEAYIVAIEQRMSGNQDVMREIEARMVELLTERGVVADGVIAEADIVALRQQMGEPRVFGDEQEADTPETTTSPVRRLMRDPDQAIIGGVCAGIAAYFGINPLWIRLVAIISPFITFGTALMVYVVLWLIVPPARTAAEKLQMRGQAVTFESLKQYAPSEEVASSIVRGFAVALRSVVTIGFLMVALGALIAVVVGSVTGWQLVSQLHGFMAQPWAWGLLISLIVGGVALVWLSSLLAVSSWRWKVTRPIGITMIITLAIGAFSVSSIALFGMQTAQEFARDEQRLTKTIAIDLPQDLTGVTHAEADANMTLLFDTRPAEIRAEVRYLAIENRTAPRVRVVRDGDTLRFSFESDGAAEVCRNGGFWPGGFSAPIDCWKMSPTIKVYGPISYKDYPSRNGVETNSVDYHQPTD